MNKLHTIQCHVPICPECGGGIKLNKTMTFQCYHCGSRYKVLNQGQTEREFICEKENRYGKVQSSNKE